MGIFLLLHAKSGYLVQHEVKDCAPGSRSVSKRQERSSGLVEEAELEVIDVVFRLVGQFAEDYVSVREQLRSSISNHFVHVEPDGHPCNCSLRSTTRADVVDALLEESEGSIINNVLHIILVTFIDQDGLDALGTIVTDCRLSLVLYQYLLGSVAAV